MPYQENKRKPIRRDFTPVSAEGAVVGRNAVRELLKSGRDVDKIFVQRGEREGSITLLVAEALDRKIPVVEVEKPKLDTLSGGGNHQGIVAMAAQKAYSSVDEILEIAEKRGEKPFVLILDGVEDIAICRLTASDVVRHALVQRIVAAYDKFEKTRLPDANRTFKAQKTFHQKRDRT